MSETATSQGADRPSARRLLVQLHEALDEASARLEACLAVVRTERDDERDAGAALVPQQRARVAVEPLDGPTRADYRDRLAALEARIAQARERGDDTGELGAVAERDVLFAELGRALGLRQSSVALPDEAVDLVGAEVSRPAG